MLTSEVLIAIREEVSRVFAQYEKELGPDDKREPAVPESGPSIETVTKAIGS